VVERIIDVFALLLLMVFAILLYPFPDWINKAGYAMLVGTVGLFVFLIVLKKNLAFFERFLNLFFRPLPKGLQEKLKRGIRSFVVGIVPLRSGWDYPVVAVLSVVIWSCYGFIIHLILYAFDFVSVYHLPWSASLIILVVTTIGIVVPPLPGTWDLPLALPDLSGHVQSLQVRPFLCDRDSRCKLLPVDPGSSWLLRGWRSCVENKSPLTKTDQIDSERNASSNVDPKKVTAYAGVGRSACSGGRLTCRSASG
jgi:hypothetical protein